MKLWQKLLLVGVALSGALYLTFRTPASRSIDGQRLAEAAPGAESALEAAGTKDLTALTIFDVTLVRLRDNYVDPSRINNKEMLLHALDYVQRNVAEVMVDANKAGNKVTVQVNNVSKTFDISSVNSLWRLATKMREIFKFIQPNLNPGSDAREIEYAAINGLLSTLDPHSTLLDPEAYKEMRVSTSQKFGGLGILIGLRKNRLTVINPMPNTPASRAGILANDHIVKINDESTINLTTTEAVNRLRGEPGTDVVVWIERKGEQGPPADGGLLKFKLRRAVIHVDSVESRLLSNNVGYLKIKQFGQTTGEELKDAMTALKEKGARAWVLDMRWNPGGLLDQAIEVADLFLDKGVIVATVGYAGTQRSEKSAVAPGTDTTSPVAVILNGGSASASEIVAGALKNQNRAVIVGQTSFGKGSVQILMDNDDDSALKLTIAQYLTPGDLSIQSVGISPDIALVPARIPAQMATAKDRVRLLAPSHLMRESDLESHLDHESSKRVEKSSRELVYLDVPPPSAAKAEEEAMDDDAPEGSEDGLSADPEDLDAPDPDQFIEDFEIKFARDYVAQAKVPSRKALLAQSDAFVEKRRVEEEAKIEAELTKLGVVWSAAPKAAKSAASLKVSWRTEPPLSVTKAGDSVQLLAEVTNTGTTDSYRAHGIVRCDDYAFDDLEFLFGKIAPGETKRFSNWVKLPREALSRLDELKLTVQDQQKSQVIEPTPLKVQIDGLARPAFGYSYQVADDEKGNGDGLLQKGEEVRLITIVKNLGEGGSLSTLATLKNNSGDGVVINKGRFDLKALEPKAEKKVDFTFVVEPSSAHTAIDLEVMVYDQTLREYVNEKITLPVATEKVALKPAAPNARARVNSDVAVYQGANATSPIIGRAQKGAVFEVLASNGKWARVRVDAGRPGFVPIGSEISMLASGTIKNAFVQKWFVTPPSLSTAAPPLEVSGDSMTLAGRATDDHAVEDVYAFVSNRRSKIDGRKVFYVSNQGGKKRAELDFKAKLPLWPGSNVVTLVAREGKEVQVRRTFIVFRSEVATASIAPVAPGSPPVMPKSTSPVSPAVGR